MCSHRLRLVSVRSLCRSCEGRKSRREKPVRRVATAWIALGAIATSWASVLAAEPAMTLQWKDNVLEIKGDLVRDKRLAINYLEAYCRPGSTKRGWNQTVIPHKT